MLKQVLRFQLIKRFPLSDIAPRYYVEFKPVGQEPILISTGSPKENAQIFSVGNMPITWIDYRSNVVNAMEEAYYVTRDFSPIVKVVYQPAAVKFLLTPDPDGYDHITMIVTDLPDDINNEPTKSEAVLHIFHDMPGYGDQMSNMAQRACFMLGGVGSSPGSVSFLALEVLKK